MITLQTVGTEIVVSVADREVVRGATAVDLVEAAQGLGDADPFKVPGDAVLSLEVPPQDLTTVMSAFMPAEQDAERLDARWVDEEEDGDWGDEWERPALARGPIVNGEPWGWLWDGERWWLLPAGAGEQVLYFGKGFEGNSMVGGATWGTIRRLSDDVAFLAVNDDVGNKYLLDVRYGIETWDPLLLRVIGAAMDELESQCPSCEESDDWGFSLNVAIPPFTEAGVEEATGWIYSPCSEHAAEWDSGGSSLLIGDHEFTWHVDRWALRQAH
jgi:hypothetical protein